MSIVAFVRSYEDYKHVISEQVKFICFDDITFKRIKEDGQECYFYDDFISKSEGDFATEYMYKLVECWHFDDKNRDVTQFEDISIGKIIEREIFFKFPMIFKRIIAYRNIIDKFKPTKIYYFDDNKYGKKVIEILQNNFKFDLIFLRTQTNINKYSVDRFSPNVFELHQNKILILASKILKFIYKSLAPVRFIKKKTSDKIRLLMYVNFPSIWDIWLNDRKINKRVQLIFPSFSPPKNIFVFLRLLISGAEIFDMEIDKNIKYDKNKVNKTKENIYRLFKQQYWKNMFNYKDINYSEVFKMILIDIIESKIDKIIAKYYTYLKALKKINPDFIITKTDYDEEWNIIVRIAQKKGIETFVLPHGITITKLGAFSLNKVADYIIAYGEGMKENFINDGVKPEKIFVIGNPLFDDHLRYLSGNFKTKVDTVLVLQYPPSNPRINSKEITDLKYILMIKEVFKNVKNKKIIFKLHPGMQVKQYFEILLRECGVNWKIVKDEKDIKDLILESCFVIGPASTGAIDTLILGRDYYYVNLEPIENNPPFDGKYLKMATNAEELKNMLKQNISSSRAKILKKFCNINGNEKYGHFSRKLFNFFINRYEKKSNLNADTVDGKPLKGRFFSS